MSSLAKIPVSVDISLEIRRALIDAKEHAVFLGFSPDAVLVRKSKWTKTDKPTIVAGDCCRFPNYEYDDVDEEEEEEKLKVELKAKLEQCSKSSKIVPSSRAEYEEISSSIKKATDSIRTNIWYKYCTFNLKYLKDSLFPLVAINCESLIGKNLEFRGSFDSKSDEKNLRELYEKLPEGVYGDITDMKTMETNQVNSVCCVRDVAAKDFTVHPSLISAIENEWEKSCLYPKNIRLEPYKINLFNEGAKFAPPSDIVSSRFVGTVIVTLHDACYAEFTVNTKRIEMKDALIAVAFYGDVVHELKVKNDGFRASLTFKVFVNSSSDESRLEAVAGKLNSGNIDYRNYKALMLSDVKEQLKRIIDKYHGIGFLTSHSLPDGEPSQWRDEFISSHRYHETLKGSDYFFEKILESLNSSLANNPIKIATVVEDFHCRGYQNYFDGAVEKVKSNVYLMRDEDMAAKLNQDESLRGDISQYQNEKESDGSIRFFHFDDIDGFQDTSTVAYDFERYIDWSPQIESSIYVFKAFILPSASSQSNTNN